MIYPPKSKPALVFSFFLAFGLFAYGIHENEPLDNGPLAERPQVIGYKIFQPEDKHAARYHSQQRQAENRPPITILVSDDTFNKIQMEQNQNQENEWGPMTIWALKIFQDTFLRGEDVSESYSSFTFGTKVERAA